MAPGDKNMRRKHPFDKLTRLYHEYVNKDFIRELIFNPEYFWKAGIVFLAAEIIVNIIIIHNVKYTEIDWVAYMQEVEGVANGTFDYTKLRGDTGPLVYPAGFVYIYLGLYYITSKGTNIRLAQYIFAAIYIILLALVFRIYHKSKKLPPYMLIFICCTSYRIHSIFVLRLFNDCIAMVFLYAAINLFIDDRWGMGSLLYSLAVSVKMNILLFAPPLLLAYMYCFDLFGTVVQLSICAAVQVALGLPFLLENHVGYIKMSFDVGRVFCFKWTVNWRFLPEEIFLDKWFHGALLALHVMLLLLFVFTHFNRYLYNYAKLQLVGVKTDIVCQLLILPLYLSNFIGIAVSRSLHYQFYIWYYHTLPYLLWSTRFSVVFRLLVLGLIEFCWNTYPSTWWSSGLLHCCHLVILTGVFLYHPFEQHIQWIKKSFGKIN